MANKSTEILNLGPVEQFEIRDDGQLLFNGDQLTHKKLENIARTTRVQSVGLMAVEEKAVRAYQTIAEINVSGVAVFDDTYGRLMAIRDKHAEGSEHYNWVASFMDQAAREYGAATIQAMRIGEKWVLRILFESPFISPEIKNNVPRLNRFGRWLLLAKNDDNDY